MPFVRNERISACALMLCVGACGGSTEPDPPKGPGPGGPAVQNVPGKTNRSIPVAGQTRTFIVYVGSSVAPATAAPVVFMFHGTSGDGDRFYQISRWREKADEAGLIAVFPDALTWCFFEDDNRDGDFSDAGERKVTTKWTSGDLGDPTELPFCSPSDVAALGPQQQALVNHPFQDDVLFVDGIVDFLKQNYVIDQKRIYGTGFSNGAQFTSRLAVERSQVFAALAAHAGNLSVPPVPARPLSFITSIGSEDDRITVLTGGELPVDESLFATYPLIKTNGVVPMLAQLGLADSYQYDEPIVNGKQIARFTFATSTAGASNTFTFAVIADNTHAYPNGVSHPVVMASVLWNFFQTQQLP